MLKGPDLIPQTTGSTSRTQCRQTPIGRELLEMLKGRMMNLTRASDRLARLVGPIDEITRAVTSSQLVMDRLDTEDSASEVESSTI